MVKKYTAAPFCILPHAVYRGVEPILYFFLSVIVCYYSSSVCAGTKVEFDRDNVVLQAPMSEDCGPTSVFNAFSLGTDSLKKIIEKLPGNTLAERYNHLLGEFAARPSTVYPGLPRTRQFGSAAADAGTSVGDMRAIISDLLNLSSEKIHFNGGYLIRAPYELPGSFVRRVFSGFRYSLDRGVPIAIAFASYTLKNRTGGHYVTVYEISDFSEAENTFQLKAFDQLSGKQLELSVYEEAYPTPIRIPLDVGFPQKDREMAESPFLKLRSRGFSSINPGGGGQSPRYFLEKAFGNF